MGVRFLVVLLSRKSEQKSVITVAFAFTVNVWSENQTILTTLTVSTRVDNDALSQCVK